MGSEGGTGYFEENHNRIQLVGADGGVEEGEGLEDVVPDIFQRHVSEVDPVCDEVYSGIKFGGCFSSSDMIQAVSEELFERLEIGRASCRERVSPYV